MSSLTVWVHILICKGLLCRAKSQSTLSGFCTPNTFPKPRDKFGEKFLAEPKTTTKSKAAPDPEQFKRQVSQRKVIVLLILGTACEGRFESSFNVAELVRSLL